MSNISRSLIISLSLHDMHFVPMPLPCHSVTDTSPCHFPVTSWLPLPVIVWLTLLRQDVTDIFRYSVPFASPPQRDWHFPLQCDWFPVTAWLSLPVVVWLTDSFPSQRDCHFPLVTDWLTVSRHSVTVTPVPAWLTFHVAVLTDTSPLRGDWQCPATASDYTPRRSVTVSPAWHFRIRVTVAAALSSSISYCIRYWCSSQHNLATSHRALASIGYGIWSPVV